jgi:hypothetical protein
MSEADKRKKQLRELMNQKKAANTPSLSTNIQHVLVPSSIANNADL